MKHQQQDLKSYYKQEIKHLSGKITRVKLTSGDKLTIQKLQQDLDHFITKYNAQ